jgi:hypothetical protein
MAVEARNVGAGEEDRFNPGFLVDVRRWVVACGLVARETRDAHIPLDLPCSMGRTGSENDGLASPLREKIATERTISLKPVAFLESWRR